MSYYFLKFSVFKTPKYYQYSGEEGGSKAQWQCHLLPAQIPQLLVFVFLTSLGRHHLFLFWPKHIILIISLCWYEGIWSRARWEAKIIRNPDSRELSSSDGRGRRASEGKPGFLQQLTNFTFSTLPSYKDAESCIWGHENALTGTNRTSLRLQQDEESLGNEGNEIWNFHSVGIHRNQQNKCPFIEILIE